MTIQERNKIALSCVGLIHKIISTDFKRRDHDDLFQIGFLAVLRAISKYSKGIIINDDPDFRSYVAAFIRNHINWYLIEEYRETHIDYNGTLDESYVNDIKIKLDFEKIKILIDKLMMHCLTYSEANLLKLYFGFDGKARSLKDMSEIMKISRERVSQLLNVAIRKLKYGNSNRKTRDLKNKLLKELKTWMEK